jgi:flagellar P-ring protein precursor FlgI
MKKHLSSHCKIGTLFKITPVVITLVFLLTGAAGAVRIKDITEIKGVRQNQLIGYGLVVGLDGTGDVKKSRFTVQSMVNMLQTMGVTVDPKDIKVKNVAAVMITANLPPFAKEGSRIDVLVSSIGGAKNLQGGTLLFTPLKAADGSIYAVAQGPISTGGFQAQGASGSGVQKNFPTVGRVVGGALVEKEISTEFNQKNTLYLALNSPDFTTASRVVLAINTKLFDQAAKAPDAGTIEIKVPEQYLGKVVQFVTQIENLVVTPDTSSKIVINERTGTVVMGDNVRISTIAIAHGNLSIQIRETKEVSQPLPFSRGRTRVTPESDVVVKEGKKPLFLVESGVSIGEVVKALNALGVSPRDLIAIFQALKAAGALQAKLEII